MLTTHSNNLKLMKTAKTSS